uniref:Uncharacterized protein n=1 Tax=Heliothis virescens TaxID=7102 RepID=A0A2A4IWD6_HELVI
MSLPHRIQIRSNCVEEARAVAGESRGRRALRTRAHFRSNLPAAALSSAAAQPPKAQSPATAVRAVACRRRSRGQRAETVRVIITQNYTPPSGHQSRAHYSRTRRTGLRLTSAVPPALLITCRCPTGAARPPRTVYASIYSSYDALSAARRQEAPMLLLETAEVYTALHAPYTSRHTGRTPRTAGVTHRCRSSRRTPNLPAAASRSGTPPRTPPTANSRYGACVPAGKAEAESEAEDSPQPDKSRNRRTACATRAAPKSTTALPVALHAAPIAAQLTGSTSSAAQAEAAGRDSPQPAQAERRPDCMSLITRRRHHLPLPVVALHAATQEPAHRQRPSGQRLWSIIRYPFQRHSLFRSIKKAEPGDRPRYTQPPPRAHHLPLPRRALVRHPPQPCCTAATSRTSTRASRGRRAETLAQANPAGPAALGQSRRPSSYLPAVR